MSLHQYHHERRGKHFRCVENDPASPQSTRASPQATTATRFGGAQLQLSASWTADCTLQKREEMETRLAAQLAAQLAARLATCRTRARRLFPSESSGSWRACQ